MPISYETISENQRVLRLKSELRFEPELTIAALIHGVVKDQLHVGGYGYAHFEEHVDLAVIVSGLGVLRSRVDLVTKQGKFWDPTEWQAIARPFLDSQGVVYANALAVWLRGESDPAWAADLETDIRRSLTKALKYLVKTEDSFLNAKFERLLDQSQGHFLEMSTGKSVSSQVIALRQFERDETIVAEQQNAIADKLRSPREPVVLSAILAAERVSDLGEHATEELRYLTRHRDHVVRARSMCALTRLEKLDEATIQTAGEMLGRKMKHEIFAGLTALASLGSVSENLIPAINRAFVRSLQICDYEFVNLFAAAFTKWLDNPRDHVQNLLQTDSPEYMEIAMEALDGVKDQLVGLT